jgi:radical SAM family uncharacterized protein
MLPRVSKPGRYTGGEYNQVRKEWDQIDYKVALAFPDIYDLGMSNLGLMILNLLAERVYSPWTDMEALMREEGMPLFSLESKHAIREFDLLGISLPYEQLFTNGLNLIDLAGMPVRSVDRDESFPLIIAGGHACYNPEPMAPFIDVFIIGEGEEVILKIIGVMRAAAHLDRETQLRHIAQIEGCYVPRFYDVAYHVDGTVEAITSMMPEAPPKVLKTIVPVLPPPVTEFIVPYIETVHNRAPVEIMRGCTRGCRFCHAGMVTRPVRERPVDEVLQAMEQILENTGYEEIALLSLSSSDYTYVLELTEKIGRRFGSDGINVSLPSLRIETVSTDLMDNLSNSRRGGFTLAPEAATEKMRNIINKYVSHEELLETAREIYRRNWRTIKLYFMIGHPKEGLEDVQAIVDLSKQVLAEGRKFHGRKASVNVGVSTFIPKPHTPFQWEAMDTFENIQAKLDLLRREMRGHGLRLRWNDAEESLFEGLLSRGDRRLSAVVERAWRKGARFDAWAEHFRQDAWNEALAEEGLDPAFYTHRQRKIDEVFPWEHIDIAVTKDLRRETPLEAWQCPPVRKRRKVVI